MNQFQMNVNQFPMGMQAQRPVGIQGQMPGHSLHVSNLATEMDEQRLYEFFSQYGSVMSVRIMRDSYSGESRGFAFVNFAKADDANRAKLVLNHQIINGKSIRINFKRNPNENDPEANLYVSNLDQRVSSRELEEAFSEYGEVVSCIVKTNDRQESLGYGYVQMANAEKASEAIKHMDKKKMFDKEVTVQKFIPKGKRPNYGTQRSNLYTKGFPEDLTKEEVSDFIDKSFGEFGSIQSKGIFQDKKSGLFYAFVAYKNNDEARAAASALKDHEFDGSDKKLYVDFAQTKSQRKHLLKQKFKKLKNETNLYIKSLKTEVTKEILEKAFEKYGQVDSSCLKTHNFFNRGTQKVENDRALQFGFLNFRTAESAKEAFLNATKDQEILDLIDPSHKKDQKFIHYAQPKNMRLQYLRMAKKNLRTSMQFQQALMMMNRTFGNMNSFNYKRMSNNMNRMRGKMGNFKNQKRNFNPEMMQSMGQMGMNVQMNPMMMSNMMMMQQQQQIGGMNMNNQMMKQQMQQLQQQQLQQMQQMQQLQQPQQMQQQQIQQQQMQQQQMQQPQQMQQQQAPKDTIRDLSWLKDHIDEFNQMSSAEKKNMLGTMMYSKVVNIAPGPLVPKITGMLIDLEVLGITEIIEILSKEDLLKERIEEAIKIIEDDNQGN